MASQRTARPRVRLCARAAPGTLTCAATGESGRRSRTGALNGDEHLRGGEVGSFYTNVTLRTPAHGRVRAHLEARGSAAYISRPEGNALVVFDRESEEDPATLSGVAANLSAQVECTALAIMNHDDSVLMYSLFQNGRLIDQYNSAPDYFGEAAEHGERGGDAMRLASAFGASGAAARQLSVLLDPAGGGQNRAFATDLHEQVVELLGLPKCAVGTGYEYLDDADYPPGYGPESFEHVGAD